MSKETFSHPLLERAHKYPYRNVDLAPPGCTYDDEIGAWRLRETGQLLVETPRWKGMTTKKMNKETGEDQKGE